MKNYNDLTTDEKLACVSLYPKEAKKDVNWYIRIEAFRALGYPKEAKKDVNDYIRREAEIFCEIKNELRKTYPHC